MEISTLSISWSPFILTLIVLFLVFNAAGVRANPQDDFVEDAKSSSNAGVLGSHSSEFFIAFGRNRLNNKVNMTLHITTIEPHPVLVTITTLREFNFSGFVTSNETLIVEIPSEFQVTSANLSDKGIQVQAHNHSSISVYGMNDANLTSDAFLALPCHHLPVDHYEYFGVSFYSNLHQETSFIIILGAFDDTMVQIDSYGPFLINRMQTFLWERKASIAGLWINSSKPIAVFAGSQCSNIPRGKKYCDHLYEQLPPSSVWGTNFLTASFEGRTSGELYRIMASQASTSVNVNCTHLSGVQLFNLSEPGSWDEFSTPAPNISTEFSKTYCSITSYKPILLMQFSLGYNFDNTGDPSMMMIVPVEQYLTKYSFTAFSQFSTNHITIYTNSENFDPQNIYVDDKSLENSTWTTVYCSSSDEICGYITYANLTTGCHTLYHSGCSSQVGMSAYGFDYHEAYAYPGGFKFSDVEKVNIDVNVPIYKFAENASTVEVCLATSNETVYYSNICFNVSVLPESSSAKDGEDFISSVSSVTLQVGETAVCSHLTLNPDSLVEGNESFYLAFTNSDIILNRGLGLQVWIVIDDSTALEIHFERSVYKVSESAGSVEVCLQSVGGNTITPGVTIEVLIEEVSDMPLDGIAIKLPSTPVMFSMEKTYACIELTLINDKSGQGDRSTSLGVEALDPQFIVNGGVTTITIFDEQEFTGCHGPDTEWGIVWPQTKAGLEVPRSCPGGSATRRCFQNGTWGEVNVQSCSSPDINNILNEANELLPDANTKIENVTSSLLEIAVNISEQLAMATGVEDETGLFPSDLDSTNQVVSKVLNVFENSKSNETNIIHTEVLVDIFNNLLSEANQAGWTQLQTMSSGSQTLLQNAERYGKIFAGSLSSADKSRVVMRENIIVIAEVVNISTGLDVVFSSDCDQLRNLSVRMNQTVEIKIPTESLVRINTGSTSTETELYFVNILFRNIEDFLPTNKGINARVGSLVLSSQLGRFDGRDIPDSIYQDNPVTLTFTFSVSSDKNPQFLGVFWNFSNPVGSGRWSSDGIQIINSETKNNVATVVFNSTHLTSFAVLVDVAGGLEGISMKERQAIKIVSYIGCIISIICLLLTLIYLFCKRKELCSKLHYFVHLNLAVTLLLGYLVFVLGIELGNRNKIACGFVAALLQYLFLSAFCWMMCEGIMLYRMFVKIFCQLHSKKWWLLFVILGYCIPLLIVVIGLAVRYEYYGVYGKDGELAYCWLSTEKGTIFAFVAPVILIILINILFLARAIWALFQNKAKAVNKQNSFKKAIDLLIATVSLLPLLGMTWLFGLLTINSNTTVFAWLFTIFNSLQGAAILFFYVIGIKRVWTTMKTIYQISSSKNSSTSGGKSSRNTLKRLLHMKPLDANESVNQTTGTEYSISTFMASESQSVSEGEVKTDAVDLDKKDIHNIK